MGQEATKVMPLAEFKDLGDDIRNTLLRNNVQLEPAQAFIGPKAQ
jgi:hypothetical protein